MRAPTLWLLATSLLLLSGCRELYVVKIASGGSAVVEKHLSLTRASVPRLMNLLRDTPGYRPGLTAEAVCEETGGTWVDRPESDRVSCVERVDHYPSLEALRRGLDDAVTWGVQALGEQDGVLEVRLLHAGFAHDSRVDPRLLFEPAPVALMLDVEGVVEQHNAPREEEGVPVWVAGRNEEVEVVLLARMGGGEQRRQERWLLLVGFGAVFGFTVMAVRLNARRSAA